MSPSVYDSVRNDRHSRHRKQPPRRWKLPLQLAAGAVCLCLIVAPTLGKSPAPGTPAGQAAPPPATPDFVPTPEPTPTPAPTPTPEPTPTPVPAFDFSQSAPERETVEMDYFADALFIGDSRTDGLRLYSGVKGADFYCYKGLTIFEMNSRKVAEIDGTKYSVLDALGRGRQYAKIYISLGINELGYFDDQVFADTFAAFLTQVKALQPGAVIYLENLAPVNPGKCKANRQPYYVNNDRVADYNAIFPRLAEEQQVVLLDVAAALSDADGVLPAEATVDGVHFTKDWYKTWLAYLMDHTVDAEEYAAGQTGAAEGESGS